MESTILLLVVTLQFVPIYSSIIHIPCPGWEDAVYLNGKCFKVFNNNGNGWYEAQEDCKNQVNPSKLAEPRTKEEFQLIMSQTSDIAWIGAYSDTGHTHRFVSDDAEVNFFGFRDPGDPAGRTPSCIKTRSKHNDVRDTACNKVSIVFHHFCERRVSDRHVIPSTIIGIPLSSGISEVILEIVPNRHDIGKQEVVLIYRGFYDSNNMNWTVLEPFNSTLEEKFVTSNFKWDKYVMTIQLQGLEIITSHSMTLTLCYKSDSGIMRAPLHSFLSPINVINTGTPKRYILATASRHEVCVLLSVISKSAEKNTINIIFNEFQNSDNLIYIDSMNVLNPSNIAIHLKQYQSVTINGIINLDGTVVTASQEVSVFITSFHATSERQEPKRIFVQQALPIQSTSNQYISVLSKLSNETNNDLYNIIGIHNEPFLMLNNQTHYLPTEGSSKEFNLNINQPFIISSENNFMLFKVFPGTPNNHVIKDMCSTPIIPEHLWKMEYSISRLWMYQVDKVHLSLIIHRNATGDFHFNNVITSLNCSNITGCSSHVACTIDPITTTSSTLIHIYSPIKFGAYLIWLSNNTIGCQIMGLNWYEDWTNNSVISTLVGKTSRAIHSPNSTFLSIITSPTQSPTSRLFTTATRPTSTSFSKKTSSTDSPTSTPLPITTMSNDSHLLLPGSTSISPVYSVTSTTQTSITTTSPSKEMDSSANETCPVKGLLVQYNLTDKEVDVIVKKLQETLRVEVKKTSSFIRRKTSAKNIKHSSITLGYSGLAFLITVIASIVISDVMTLYKFWENRRMTRSTEKTSLAKAEWQTARGF